MKPFRALSLLTVLAIFPASVAQAQPAPCSPISPTDRVVVTTADQSKIRGTVVCLTDTGLVLLRDGITTETPLRDIRRIETRPDPVWDGAVKGGAIPLIVFAIFCRDECNADVWLKNIAAYSLIGLTWDAAQRNSRTVYAGRPAPSVAWRVRF